MPAKDFEKQVQEKLEELRFAPSDAVWPQVEEQIARRKKRRVIFWFFLLALTAGGSTALWFAAGSGSSSLKDLSGGQPIKNTDNTTPRPAAKDVVTIVDSSKGGSHQQAAVPSDHAASATSPLRIEDAPMQPKSSVEKPEELAAKSAADNRIISRNKPGRTNKAKSHGKQIQSPQKRELSAQEQAGSEPVLAVAGTEIVKTSQGDKQDIVGSDKKSTEPSQEGAKPGTIDSTATGKIDSQQAESKKQSADSSTGVAKAPEMAKKKKLEWGVQIGGGVSNILNGLSGSSDKSVFASAPNSSTGSGTVTNNNSGTGIVPAQKAGFSWSAGLSLQYPIGKKSRLVSGIQYNYFSSSMTVGAQQPSAFSQFQYARTGTSTDYTNHFHFLTVPVTMQRKIGKSRFSLEGGAALSILLGSDALLYDAQKDLFTRAGSSITNPQLQLLAGFNYHIPNKAFGLELGPRFSYGLTNIFGAESTGARHLMYVGINAGIFFHHRK